MSRYTTQSEVDPLTSKLAMITANIARISSQNSKLQEMISHRQHLQRLRYVSQGSANNCKRLTEVSQFVQKIYQQAATERQNIHFSLNHRSEVLNKTILTQIQSARLTLSNLEVRLGQIKTKESFKMRKGMQAIKSKSLEGLDKKKAQYYEILQRVQKQFKATSQQGMQQLYDQCEQEMDVRYNQCRIALGHLHNLIAYYHWKKLQGHLQNVSLSEITVVNFQSIITKIAELDVKQRKIKGQIDWLKGRARKDKCIQKKAKEIQYEPQQILTVSELGLGIEECQNQLLGMDRICDEKSKIQNKSFTQLEIGQLVKIKERLKSLKQKLKQYSSFYKETG